MITISRRGRSILARRIRYSCAVWPLVMNFGAFYLADLFLKQPMLLIAGDKAESRWHTDKFDQVLGGATEKVIVSNEHIWISLTGHALSIRRCRMLPSS